ncbi:glycoside hydrolase family 5 protein [Ktedonosporobacter rubrisoli]|nr:cellulase family glycosylhydrolase [Ktedonosporobacter rubrisoli]
MRKTRLKISTWSILCATFALVSLLGIGLIVLNRTVAQAAGSLPYNATANGPYTVQGNKILGKDGRQYIIHGMARDGLEYNCRGEGPLDKQTLAYMGPGNSTNGSTYWGANTIRLPLSEVFWLSGQGSTCTAAQYQALVKGTVDTITALHMNVMLDLHWVGAGRQSTNGGGQWPMPDGDSVTFWQQIATQYRGYSNVFFELYNEPVPPNWPCWQKGCQVSGTGYSNDCHCSKQLSYQAVGMQTLVDTVRKSGASNLVIVGGSNWGFDLSQLPNYPISGTNIVYDTHPYAYANKSAKYWDWAFGNLSSRYPIISAENGQYDCKEDYMSQLLPYLDSHQMGWVAWAWVVNGNVCGYPQLVTDYRGTPANSMGVYIYKSLQRYRS